MAIDNKDKKVLKSSIEREQNEVACSAECEKIKGSKNLNVPHLRFPEFSGEWKKCKLGDLCNVLMCKRILVSQTNTEDGVPFYKIGTIGSTPDAYISKELFDDYKVKYNYPRKGEVMITCAGTVGKCVVYDGEDAYFQDSNIVWIDNPTQYISNGFLFHLLSKVDWRKLNSTTIIRIYNDDLRNLKMSYPRKEEQQKISHLLSLLDERIATQNKIIEKLQSLIKGLAAQLTQSGTPNIRLCDCLECHSSTLLENCVSVTGSYPVYGATGLIGYTNNYAYNGESILIVKDGSGVGSLSYVNDHFSVIGTLNYLTAKENYSILYLYYALMAFNFTPYITGMAIPHIYFKDYGKAKLFYPSIEKRIRIASLLHNIEQKLVVEQNLVISLSTQKSYLLRMLFI